MMQLVSIEMALEAIIFLQNTCHCWCQCPARKDLTLWFNAFQSTQTLPPNPYKVYSPNL